MGIIIRCVMIIAVLFATRLNVLAASDDLQASKTELVKQYYKLGGIRLGMRDGRVDTAMYQSFKQLLDSCAYDGLNKDNYHYDRLFSIRLNGYPDSTWQELYTNAIIYYCKDIYEGTGIGNIISYNGMPELSYDPLLRKIAEIKTRDDLERLVSSLQPAIQPFNLLKNELRTAILSNNALNISRLKSSMNCLRWISHFQFQKCVVVNIPSATLNYYEKNDVALNMKIVAGKPSTKTPRFAAYCNEVILYPYWHVPRSIAVNELLPVFKRRPSALAYMNLQVLDSRGRIVVPSSINWKQYNKYNFPYQFRQSTGCDNALGVIKFNLTSPYSVYMHDTNLKGAFTSQNRYLSHGCIRIEKPVQLANYLVPHKIDSAFLQACVRNQKPVVYKLEKQMPVFVLYMIAWTDEAGGVIYYKDIYNL